MVSVSAPTARVTLTVAGTPASSLSFGPRSGFEPGVRNGHAIGAAGQTGDGPVAFFVGVGFKSFLLADVEDFDRSGGRGPSIIGDSAVQTRGSDLAKVGHPAHKKTGCEKTSKHRPLP